MTAPNRAARRAKAPAPAAPHRLDLDARRAARREARGQHVEVQLGGELFQLPTELPVDSLEPLAELADLQGDAVDELDPVEQSQVLRRTRVALAKSLAGLFCDEGLAAPRDDDDLVDSRPATHEATCSWRRFTALRPTLEDQLELWELLLSAYGVSLGEALARTESAGTTGAP